MPDNLKKINNWSLLKPVTMGLLVFLLLGSLSGFLSYQRYQLLENERKQAARNVAESAKERLQQSLQYSLSATQALALTIKDDGFPDNIDSIAETILSVNKHIDALQLVPGGIIRYIYPLQGNEQALNYNVFADSTRNKEAYKAVTERKLYFAGPFLLKQGGTGVVGRLPVFIGSKFWGFSAVLIKLSTLLEAAGIDTTGEGGYYFQLSKINPDTKKEEFFLPLKEQLGNQFVGVVSVPDGEWKLYVIPVKKFRSFYSILPVVLLSFLLSIVGGYFTAYVIRKPAELQKLVLRRTAELDQSERRNKAILNALPDLVLIIDKENRFSDFIKPKEMQTYVPPELFIGRKVSEVLPAELAEKTIINKLKALTTGDVTTYSYQLKAGNEDRDYEARYVTHGKEDVLVLIRDITETKRAERMLKESEEKYRTLVEQASDGIFIADFKGRFIVVNPAGYKLSQYSAEELKSQTIYDFVFSEDLKEMPFQMEELAAGKTAISERRMRRKDGSVIDVEITARIIAQDRFLAFIRDITERKKVQQELLKSREELRQLSNHLENIREEERMHIAREIHDELGQHLTVIKMDISRLGKKIAGNEVLEKEVQEILEMINTIVATVRKISSELRPSMLDDLGLVAALEWYSRDFIKRTGIKTSFNSSVGEMELPDKTKTGFFRIFQESLTNVARHSEATEVNTSLYRKDNKLFMVIHDNGKGFDALETIGKRTLGLLGMKERALMMGGRFVVSSSPGNGTEIEVAVSLENVL
ncbi:MAG: PAS domain S-box protein [Chitinophagales bacterium]|nr:PAS domain S-box protein [Chitinophagales bacterium]